jgi:hypothetical protein
MSAVLPLHAFIVDKPDIGFVDKCSRMETVAGSLGAQGVPGEPAKFVVDDRSQLTESGLIPLAPGPEQDAGIGRARLRYGVHTRVNYSARPMIPKWTALRLS